LQNSVFDLTILTRQSKISQVTRVPHFGYFTFKGDSLVVMLEKIQGGQKN